MILAQLVLSAVLVGVGEPDPAALVGRLGAPRWAEQQRRGAGQARRGRHEFPPEHLGVTGAIP